MGGYSMVVLKTTNGGVSWPIRSFPGTGGSYGTYCEAIAVAPGAPTTVYAGGQEDYYAKIFCSTDAGATWEDISGALDTMLSRYDTVYAIWVSPLDPRMILAGTSQGVFKRVSTGRGRDCIWSSTDIQHSTNSLAYDPLSGIIYAATVNGVFETDDAGSSWRELNDGLACLDTSCIVLDSDNSLLYVGTNGGSVWRRSIAPIDLNSDGIVNFEDYAVLAYNWLDECFAPDWCQGGDLNRDGIVDFGDFLDLANHWLQ